jgi:septum formation protein
VPEAEEVDSGDPGKAVIENARRKARSVREVVGAEAAVLAVDTVVALDGKIHPKPADQAAARSTLEALSGRTHTVLSCLVLFVGGNEAGSGTAATEVTFRALGDELIDLYLASGEWRERAGGYAIQGLGSVLVERIEGDFSNVVGLPVPLLIELAPELIS